MPRSHGPATTGWAWLKPRWSRARVTLLAIWAPRGIRVNLVAAGPLRTAASHGEPSFVDIAAAWQTRAPLGWNSADANGVARTCVALLSDWFPVTTGEIVHADGGFHTAGV